MILHSSIVQPLRAKYTELADAFRAPDHLWRKPPPDRLAARRDRAGSSKAGRDIGNILVRAAQRDGNRQVPMRPRCAAARLAASEDMVRLKAPETSIAQVAQSLRGEPGPLPEPARALHRGHGAARQPAAGRARHLAGPDPAGPVLPQLAARDRPVLRRLRIARDFSSWSSSSGSARSSTAWKTSNATSGCRSSARFPNCRAAAPDVEPGRLHAARAACPSSAAHSSGCERCWPWSTSARCRAPCSSRPASAGEGKTTVAMCLGIASALSGQKVLLVDCNFAGRRCIAWSTSRTSSGSDRCPQRPRALEDTITLAAGYQPLDPDHRPLARRRDRSSELRKRWRSFWTSSRGSTTSSSSIRRPCTRCPTP